MSSFSLYIQLECPEGDLIGKTINPVPLIWGYLNTLLQAWKEKVLPHLHRHLARNVDKVVSYMVLYHEVTLANLLEVSCCAEAAWIRCHPQWCCTVKSRWTTCWW